LKGNGFYETDYKNKWGGYELSQTQNGKGYCG
jgi:hypothetical protein